MKRTVTLLLTLMLIMALSVSAFAATYTLTIPNSKSGYIYAAYQVFKGDISGTHPNTVLSNIEWGDGVNGNAIATAVKNFLGDTSTGTYTASEVAAMLAETTDTANKKIGKFDFSDIVAQNLSTTASPKTSTYSNNQYTISGLDGGYYFVKNTQVPTDGSYTEYMLRVLESVSVSHKGNVPSVEKKVKDINNSDASDPTNNVWQDSADHDIGDVINYKFTGTLPDGYEYYNTYYYKFTDTLSAGLTYNNNAKVYLIHTISGQDYYYPVNSRYTASFDNNSNKLTVEFKDLKNITLDKTDKIAVYYTATLNDNAQIGPNGNPNEVYLTFSNNPNDSGTPGSHPDSPNDPKNPQNPNNPGTPGEPNDPTNPNNPNTPITPGKNNPPSNPPTGETPKDKVTVFSFKLDITKVDNSTPAKALKGAKFTLYKLISGSTNQVQGLPQGYEVVKVKEVNGNYYVDPNGSIQELAGKGTDENKFIWNGIDDGKYILVESTVPQGYNKMKDIYFTVTAIHDATSADPQLTDLKVTDVKDKDGNQISGMSAVKADGAVYDTIVNETGTVLPETGGIGVTIFYVIGTIMILGVIVLDRSRRRMTF